MSPPESIKKGLECCINNERDIYRDYISEGLAYIQQLEADKSRLQNQVYDQRCQLRKLCAMYEWAQEVLKSANLNDTESLQRYLQDKGYDPITFELPDTPKDQLHIRNLEARVAELTKENEDLKDELELCLDARAEDRDFFICDDL